MEVDRKKTQMAQVHLGSQLCFETISYFKKAVLFLSDLQVDYVIQTLVTLP